VEWKDGWWIGKKPSCSDFKEPFQHSPGGTEENDENLSQDRLSTGRDLNAGLPEYEAGALTTRQRCSVGRERSFEYCVVELTTVPATRTEGSFRDAAYPITILKSSRSLFTRLLNRPLCSVTRMLGWWVPIPLWYWCMFAFFSRKILLVEFGEIQSLPFCISLNPLSRVVTTVYAPNT
jgi:hypothetical protein